MLNFIPYGCAEETVHDGLKIDMLLKIISMVEWNLKFLINLALLRGAAALHLNSRGYCLGQCEYIVGKCVTQGWLEVPEVDRTSLITSVTCMRRGVWLKWWMICFFVGKSRVMGALEIVLAKSLAQKLKNYNKNNISWFAVDFCLCCLPQPCFTCMFLSVKAVLLVTGTA